MAGPNTLAFDDANFEAEVINSDLPVVVDFWAQWCGPCMMVGPVIDELADDFAGKVKVGKVDIDTSGTIATKFGVQNIPTVLIFKQGEVCERIVGAKHKRDYEAALNKHLG